MNRIGSFELNGEQYPLNLSMKATRLISERFGGMENVEEAVKGKSIGEVLGTLSWLLTVLMHQGFAYCDLTGAERPEKLFKQEELEVLLQPADIPAIQKAVFGTIASGAAREVETEDGGKNVETTQG